MNDLNPSFNYGEFAIIKTKSGLNSFKTSAKELIEKANVVCLMAKAGRYGGTYAHKDIAFEFAMFGMTAKQWRDANPGLKGNIRDYAAINQLICLSNMENLNAVFINDGITQRERLERLNRIAIEQMKVLENIGERRLLK